MWFDPRKALAEAPPQKSETGRPPDAIHANHANPPAPISTISTISTPPAADIGNPTEPDPDGVARTPEAVEAVWSDAVRKAVEHRRNMPVPTCSRCGVSDWLVAITEPDGRRLHVGCWKTEASERKKDY